MTRYEALIQAITANPGDDAPRIAFADHIRASDPERAQFIDRQLESARRRRERRSFSVGDPDDRERLFESSWSRLIAKYARDWRYDRGFVAKLFIDPYLFLEYGEWLLINFPVTVVNFVHPDEGPFPWQELADSPLLASLEAIVIWDRFRDIHLTQADVLKFCVSPHLARLRYLGFPRFDVTPEAYEALASIPAIKKLLVLGLEDPAFPGQRFEETDEQDMQGRYLMRWSPVSEHGRELEAAHGYLPWLHRANGADAYDVGYFVAKGLLPVRAPGSR